MGLQSLHIEQYWVYYLSERELVLSAEKTYPARSHVSLHTCAYFCFFFFLAEPNASSSLFPDWLSSTPLSPPAALGILLTSGCATSRHCQQHELPGVRIHCCDSDLCNSAASWHPGALHYIGALFGLLLLRMWLWYGVSLERDIKPVDYEGWGGYWRAP